MFPHQQVAHYLEKSTLLYDPRSAELRAEYCDKHVCVCVRKHISRTTLPSFTKFSVHIALGSGVHGSYVEALRRTSGFMDNVTSGFPMIGFNGAGNASVYRIKGA